MILAFSAKGGDLTSVLDPRFGRAEYFVLVDEKGKQIGTIDNREIVHVAHGAGPQTAQKLIEAGAEVLVTGNGPGGNALRVLKSADLKIFLSREERTVEEALNAYQQSKLTEF